LVCSMVEDMVGHHGNKHCRMYDIAYKWHTNFLRNKKVSP